MAGVYSAARSPVYKLPYGTAGRSDYRPFEIPDECIARSAYLIWLDSGQVDGHDKAHWCQAEVQLYKQLVSALTTQGNDASCEELCVAIQRLARHEVADYLQRSVFECVADSVENQCGPRLHRPPEHDGQEGLSLTDSTEAIMQPMYDNKKLVVKSVEEAPSEDDLCKAMLKAPATLSVADKEKYSGQFAVIHRLGELRGRVMAAAETFREAIELARKTGRPGDFLVKQLP